jgi:oligoendopeptidase F
MTTLPTESPDWNAIHARYAVLRNADLTPEDVPAWLRQWSDLVKIAWEIQAILHRDTTRDLTDVRARDAEQTYEKDILPGLEEANQALRLKLLSLRTYQAAPENVELVRRWHNEADLYRAANVDLRSAISPLEHQYLAGTASLTVVVAGEEVTSYEVEQRLQAPDRQTREMVWRARRSGWIQHREEFNALFLRQLALRRQLARNADLPDYRAYRWREMNRFGYTPNDARAFDAAVELEIVPLVVRLCEAKRRHLGVRTLRPWDALVPTARTPLHPFTEVADLEAGVGRVLTNVDAEFGALFERMRLGGSFDLAPRKEKRFGGECWFAPVTGLPFINMHASGTIHNMYTLIHECGHAIHSLISVGRQELIWNMGGPEDFCEFAAQTMEFLAEPYLERAHGGFFSAEEAARCRADHMEDYLTFLPQLAAQDAFAQWVFAEAPEDVQPSDLDAKWLEIADRFLKGEDWSGLEVERAAGWQRDWSLFFLPLYQLNYALAFTGALQVLRAAQTDQAAAVRAFRRALTLGDTRPLPTLYRAAGVRMPFEPGVMHEVAITMASYLQERLA